MRFANLLVLLSFVSCTSVFYQPSRHQFTNPIDYKLQHQEVWFASSDGTKLHGWFFPAKAKQSKGTIVQFHGNAQNISTHYFSLIWLIEQGYNLFTWDYRGYGKSEGESSQEGIYHDSLAAIEKAWELHDKKGSFVVFGQSLGGAISLRALADSKHSKDVSLLVHDSSFLSYQDISFHVLKSKWFLWPISPLAYVLISDKYSAENFLEKIPSPILVIVGEQDQIIPSNFGKETYEKIPNNRKWLWELSDGKHIDVFHHHEGKYRRKFLDLLDEIARK